MEIRKDQADIFILEAEASEITSKIKSLDSFQPLIEDFAEFRTIKVPKGIRVAEMGSSRNKAKVFDFEYIDQGGQEKVLPVVIKVIERECFENEMKAYQKIREANVTFPHLRVAFGFEKDEKYYFATIVKPNLMPISGKIKALFQEARSSQELLNGYRSLISSIACAQLRINSVGILQSDLHPKNTGIDTQTGEIYAYDFELARSLERKGEPANEEDSIEEIKDILVMCGGYALKGYFMDDLTLDNTSTANMYITKRKKLLEDLDVDVTEFRKISLEVMSKVRNFYSKFGNKFWSPEMDDEILRQILGKEPRKSYVDYDEIIFDSIKLAGSLGLDSEGLKSLNR